eukprot:784365-Pyramimonas_sp.AAC.1
MSSGLRWNRLARNWQLPTRPTPKPSELHAAVVPAKEPGAEEVLSISLDQLLDGKAVIKFSGVESLFGLADYVDAEESDLEQAKKREKELLDNLSRSATELFGKAREKAKSAKAEHEKVKERLQGKKRKTDEGETVPAAASAGEPAAASEG